VQQLSDISIKTLFTLATRLIYLEHILPMLQTFQLDLALGFLMDSRQSLQKLWFELMLIV